MAGVSKATLYSYFPDKRLLFSEVARMECNRQADAALAEFDADHPIDCVLRLAADRIVRFFLSDFGQQVFRICVAESHRFPELGCRFYESGPAMVRDRLIGVLKPYVASGVLKIDDMDLAANQFGELCKERSVPAQPVRRRHTGHRRGYRARDRRRGRDVPGALPRLSVRHPLRRWPGPAWETVSLFSPAILMRESPTM